MASNTHFLMSVENTQGKKGKTTMFQHYFVQQKVGESEHKLLLKNSRNFFPYSIRDMSRLEQSTISMWTFMVILLIILVSTRNEIFVSCYEVMVNVGHITIIGFYVFLVTKISTFSLLL